jgi:hypothetical protein
MRRKPRRWTHSGFPDPRKAPPPEITVPKKPPHLSLSLACAWALTSCSVYQIPPREPLTTEQIVQLTREGQPPEVIIDKIRASGTVYIMSADDVVKLNEQGVDKKVIDEMLQTEKRDLQRRAYYHYPYWYPHGHVHYGVVYDPWWCW